MKYWHGKEPVVVIKTGDWPWEKRARFRFWSWVHDALEKAWHWVYYKGVMPNRPNPEANLPGTVFWNNEGIYRQNADGSWTKLSSNIDLGDDPKQEGARVQ